MFKSLMGFKRKKDNICARPGCNNPIKKEKNGTEFNYCSSSCQMSNYSPGSSEFYDEFLDSPSYTSASSNQWGVWSPNQDEAPPSYTSISNENDLFGSIDDVQVTPLWEADDDPPSNSRFTSSSKIEDDFPLWLDSQVDPLWTHPSNKNTSNRNTSSRSTSNKSTSNRNTSRNYSPPATPRSNSPSDEEEVHCPRCTFFIRPNKTVCEMCGTSITRQEPKRNYNKSSSKSKSTITSYRDLYDEEEEDEDEDEEDEDKEDEDPFADQPPRRNNRSSYSTRDNYKNSSSKSRNQSSYDNYDNYGYSQSRNQYSSRNQSSSRSRTSGDNMSSFYQTPTPPSDGLWIDDDEDYFEPIPTRKTSRQRPPPKPYTTPSFLRETESRPKRNVQRPPTPPLKEKQLTCPACNFDNHHSMTHCEICYTQLNKTPERDNKRQDNRRNSNFNRIEQTRAKKACATCSYYNDVDSVQCEMCYRPLETIRKSIFTLPSFFSHDVDKTQCPVCTFMNHHTMVQCEMCRNVLPGSDLKQQQQQYQQIVDNTPGPVTKLINLPVDDHDYMTVQQNFKAAPNGVPNAKILAIFRVIMPDRIIKAHEAYKKQIAGNNPVANVTHRMFHGSHVACDAKRYYGPPGWAYCNAADCGLCGIAQNGNSCAKSKYNGRMWFASKSQTSLGYCRTDPVKAMFIQEIISQTGGDVIIVDKEAATLVKFLIIFTV